MVTVPKNDPDYEDLMKQHTDQIAAFNHVMNQHTLLKLRDVCARRINGLYPATKHKSDEFKTLIHGAVLSAESEIRVAETLLNYSGKD